MIKRRSKNKFLRLYSAARDRVIYGVKNYTFKREIDSFLPKKDLKIILKWKKEFKAGRVTSNSSFILHCILDRLPKDIDQFETIKFNPFLNQKLESHKCFQHFKEFTAEWLYFNNSVTPSLLLLKDYAALFKINLQPITSMIEHSMEKIVLFEGLLDQIDGILNHKEETK